MPPLEFERLDKIPVIYGRRPRIHEKEFSELKHYESGCADMEADYVKGPFGEPWLNVVNAYEPSSMPAFEQILRLEGLRKKIYGKILDLGAGTCWLTAKLSLLPDINQVFALDLSERFMFSAGMRVLKYLHAEFPKITFVVSDFNEIPLENESIDCAFLFGSIHHSLSPIKTLQEVSRCVKKGGVIMILESPISSIRIWAARERSFGLNKNATEIAYTMRELEYIIKISNLGLVKRYSLDILSKGGIKMLVRRILRKFGVEDLLINPPTYLFMVEKNGRS